MFKSHLIKLHSMSWLDVKRRGFSLDIWLWELRKPTKFSVKILGASAEIRTTHFPITDLKINRLSQRTRFCWWYYQQFNLAYAQQKYWFDCGNWGNPRRFSASAEIRTRHFPNTDRKLYRLSQRAQFYLWYYQQFNPLTTKWRLV
jgi:hypothetical protein